jgi:Domain of unknown function (DUF4159)
LGSVFVPREDRPSKGELRVTWAVDPKRGATEPLAWLPLVDRLFNRTGLELKVQGGAIDQIGRADTPLVYLGGALSEPLTAGELRGLVRYINDGGTLLVETIGGRGGYADQVLRQLEAVFGEQSIPLENSHPIITGDGLVGGYDQRVVGYRRYSTLNRGLVETPRLEAIRVGGRVAVIASREDLSLGVLGTKRWGVDGYDIDSSRKLLSNILLYTAQQGPRAGADVVSTGAGGAGDNGAE